MNIQSNWACNYIDKTSITAPWSIHLLGHLMSFVFPFQRNWGCIIIIKSHIWSITGKLIGFEIGAQNAAAVGHCPFGFVYLCFCWPVRHPHKRWLPPNNNL